MAGTIDRIDSQIADIFADWSYISTLLCVAIVAFVAYPVIFAEEPDTHPLLLARQSQASPVRQKNESAVYRSPEIPHGYPLKSGLNVKEDGAAKWASGKDGDLRDVWREVRRGGTTGSDGRKIPQGVIMTVFGREETVDHDVEDLTREIITIGKHLKDSGAKNVAIYLPNDIEFLLTIFACAFYGLSPILLPYNQPHPKVYELFNAVNADGLVCAAGSLPLDDVAKSCPKLRQLVWVVEKTSRHMDWSGAPEAVKGRLGVSVWHDIVDESKAKTTNDLPSNESVQELADIITVWQPSQPEAKAEIVPFTHRNLVSAIAALITALPIRQRLHPGDLFLAADSFTNHYTLCQTLGALYSHASLAITSVASPGVSLSLASRSVAPTVIIASPETLAALHTTETTATSSLLQRYGNFSHQQTLSAGRMPTDTLLFKAISPPSTATGNSPGKLRLILTSERLGAGSPPLTSTMLSDLRIFTRARICYALTAAQVAGAVTQTNVFDYRREEGNGPAHFGVPVSSVEIKLVNKDDGLVGGASPSGDVVVAGPSVSESVAGGKINLGVRGRVREDGTVVLE